MCETHQQQTRIGVCTVRSACCNSVPVKLKLPAPYRLCKTCVSARRQSCRLRRWHATQPTSRRRHTAQRCSLRMEVSPFRQTRSSWPPATQRARSTRATFPFGTGHRGSAQTVERTPDQRITLSLVGKRTDVPTKPRTVVMFKPTTKKG